MLLGGRAEPQGVVMVHGVSRLTHPPFHRRGNRCRLAGDGVADEHGRPDAVADVRQRLGAFERKAEEAAADVGEAVATGDGDVVRHGRGPRRGDDGEAGLVGPSWHSGHSDEQGLGRDGDVVGRGLSVEAAESGLGDDAAP